MFERLLELLICWVDTSYAHWQVLLDLVKALNKRMNPDGEETFLLPMAVAEGSPTHPAYPSGHAINVGAYVTALKVMVYGIGTAQPCLSITVKFRTTRNLVCSQTQSLLGRQTATFPSQPIVSCNTLST